LLEDPFVLQLETHKLKGKLSGSWACSAGYDLRIVFDFVKAEKGDDNDIFLLSIGTHDEVYSTIICLGADYKLHPYLFYHP
jgi:mRNA-degrading endonuclease YafQ of YafQ-DinJ toxin-antitoxin module